MQPGVGYRFSSSSSGITLDIGDPWPDNDGGDGLCPLEAYGLREVSGAIKFNVYPGMVNNQIVRSNDMILLTDIPPPDITAFTGGVTSTLQSNYVYIRCGNAAGPPAVYPNTSGEGRSSVRVFDTEQVDSDTYSYILIAVLTAKVTDGVYDLTLQRMIGCNSLWSVRLKCGTDPAMYWWSAV
jgi:hypothetical protein